jgi:crotonobetainyl-CoA:carnitine CoA-transferase CaiB-like acyl-CoA transferase
MLISLFQQWETLVEWMDNEGMAEDLKEEKYEEEEFRQNHRDHIMEVLQRWTKTHTAKELFESGQLMRFPWAPVCSAKEVLESPQLKARGFFVEVDHPEIGAFIQYPGAPYKFDGFSFDRWKRAPLIGEDNFEIYQGELGLSKEDLKKLSSIHAI